MDSSRLHSLLSRFPNLTALVVGDFFLDKYLWIDRRLAEASLETGLEAHQVVEMRCSPGAAGTVTANLRALGVNVVALGVIGDDGEGYELRRALRALGAEASILVERADRFTPTYTKPMLREAGGAAHELNRLDIKNRTPLPRDAEETLVLRLRHAFPRVQGVVVADQVPEADCGAITGRVRAEVCRLARDHPDKPVVADSRERIGLFEAVALKPNAREAVRAVDPNADASDARVVEACGLALAARARRPVFVTVGARGIVLCADGRAEPVRTVPARGAIDPVGAGDSAMAGIVAALCAGASPREAATVGNLVASITIEQIGTTGVASPEQVRGRFEAWYHSNGG